MASFSTSVSNTSANYTNKVQAYLVAPNGTRLPTGTAGQPATATSTATGLTPATVQLSAASASSLGWGTYSLWFDFSESSSNCWGDTAWIDKE